MKQAVPVQNDFPAAEIKVHRLASEVLQGEVHLMKPDIVGDVAGSCDITAALSP